MFYKILKKFFFKKNVNNRLQKQEPIFTHQKIKTIGLLVDEDYFLNTTGLVDEILKYGFAREQIQVLVYKDRIKSKEAVNEPFLALRHISISGEINKVEVINFLEIPFDLLINYYEVSKYSLMLLSIKSIATFKVGFDSIDKRVNNLIISEEVDRYKEFTSELFKYLKILNKI